MNKQEREELRVALENVLSGKDKKTTKASVAYSALELINQLDAYEKVAEAAKKLRINCSQT